MKIKGNYLGKVLLLCMFLITGCSNIQKTEDVSTVSATGNGRVTFGIANATPTTQINGVVLQNGNPNAQDVATAEPVSVCITLQKENGDYVPGFDNKKIGVVKFGDTFVTQPLDLAPGNYKLIQYLVLDDSDNAILATPLTGSPYEHLVRTPLSIDVVITKDQVTTVVPEVISTTELNPIDFGYISFQWTEIRIFGFHAAVLMFDHVSHTFQLTSAEISISAGDFSYTRSVDDVTTLLVVKEIETHDDYVLTVSKPGFDNVQITLTEAELKAHYEDALEFYIGTLPNNLWDQGNWDQMNWDQ